MAQIPTGPDRPGQLTTRQRGACYETQARRWLESQGMEFLAANAQMRGGELDLIMRHHKTLVFVEVRYRQNHHFGGAVASITPVKRRHLLRAASQWLARQNGSFDTVDCRFDVVAFTGDEIAWLPNAFTTDY
ncbi:UPF0102 protein [Salmonella enterica subsp. enterica serovar Choleraesuis]|nr:UPF0102 protein [Salmonella enterica subsp. enterica serovar Choleraesuis]